MRPTDPRPYQIAVLTSLLAYGTLWLDFGVRWTRVGLVVVAALAIQYLCTRVWRLPRYDPRSALISGLSLSLLLRTASPLLAVGATAVTIASKFVIRVDDRHVFNPTNLGLVAMMTVAGDQVWVSPGQWGQAAFFGFLLASVGMVVVHRAARSDVTLAFLAVYGGLVVGRGVWLGDPLTIAVHHLQSGALVLFAFFMISDPKTTPDSRAGRMLFATLVAVGSWYGRFVLYEPTAPLWALAACATTVPLFDRWLPGDRYSWLPSSGRQEQRITDPTGITQPPQRRRRLMHTIIRPAAFLLAWLTLASPAAAFCGFYVTKADTQLFNKASQVVLVRDEDRTVLTMANDYRGDPTEFAMVIPVPTVLERGQIHVGDKALIDHLDAYSAPRLVEYFDENPCQLAVRERMAAPSAMGTAMMDELEARNDALGVTIEASYTVGEYDILILSARESDGLETWLVENGYRIPPGASSVLGSYIRQDMKFFVAKVNLEEQSALGFTYLRPLQIAYESPKFMLPIRLGTVNADGPQDLFVYALTRTGRVETTNYRTVKLPSDVEIPLFVKDDEEFGAFYQAMFDRQVDNEHRRGVFLEYAWDMSWCDPCAANPPSHDQLRDLGVFWLDQSAASPRGGAQPTNVFLTRLHVRYDAEHFPDDLRFQTTGDRTNFQGRYILRHPWTGTDSCDAVAAYRETLARRYEQQAQTLASLTGWDINEIRERMGPGLFPQADERSWWQRLWDR